MVRRKTIRRITHRGMRWLVTVLARKKREGLWSGHLRFHLDEPMPATLRFDPQRFDGESPEELWSVVSKLDADELRERLTAASD